MEALWGFGGVMGAPSPPPPAVGFGVPVGVKGGGVLWGIGAGGCGGVHIGVMGGGGLYLGKGGG